MAAKPGLTDLIVTAGKPGAVRFRAYRVEVIEGPDAGKSAQLERGSMIVGSASEADLCLDDPSVSRAHAKLVPFIDGVEVTDLGSKNGTFLAGTRLEKARVAPGSQLTLGRSKLRLIPEDHDVTVEPSERTRFGLVHGRSRPMRELITILEMVSGKDAPILIEGEAGVGKERVARAIHEASPRKAGCIHVITADSSQDDLLPAEMPTNATTILIKDVDALNTNAQRLVSAALENKRLDARFMATTRADLDRAAAAGTFDRALLLTLGVVRVRVPPLRERASDLPMLIEDILGELGHPSYDLGPADLGRMQAYAWPDNVRELRSVIERAVLLEHPGLDPASNATDAVVGGDLPYKQARSQMIEAFEREYVRSLLSKHDGNISRAARAAGIDRVYLHRLIKKYGL